MDTVTEKIHREAKANKKKSALKMLSSPDANKSEIASKIGVTRKTLYNWINQKKQKVIELKPNDKIKLWERESLKDIQGAAYVRDLMLEEIEKAPEKVSIATKNNIQASLTLSSCQKWDKSRLEAGQSTSNISYAQMVRATEGKVIDVTPGKETTPGNSEGNEQG